MSDPLTAKPDTYCNCCGNKLPQRRLRMKRDYNPLGLPAPISGSRYYPDYGICRLCGDYTCCRCLFIDSVCAECTTNSD